MVRTEIGKKIGRTGLKSKKKMAGPAEIGKKLANLGPDQDFVFCISEILDLEKF